MGVQNKNYFYNYLKGAQKKKSASAPTPTP